MRTFVLELSTRKDLNIFNYNAKQYVLMGDATESIAAIVAYYSFLLCDKNRNSEPLANIEILSDSHDELPIRHCLKQFIVDEKRKFGHYSSTVPVLLTYDIPWPIVKSAIRCLSNESIEEYFSRSCRVNNGRASSLGFHVKLSILFLHFFLSHIMHAFSRRLGK